MLKYSVRRAILKAEEDRLAAMTPEEKAANESEKANRRQQALRHPTIRYCDPCDHRPFSQALSPQFMADIRQSTRRVRDGKSTSGT